MSNATITLPHPPFGPAFAGRCLQIWFLVEEPDADGDLAPKSLTSRWAYRVRAWVDSPSSTTFVFNEVLTKDSATGWIRHVLALGSTARAALRWELVEVDTSTTADGTPTGKAELVLHHWVQAVDPAAQSGP